MVKWEDFFLKKMQELVAEDVKLDLNDPAVKAIMNNPAIVAAYTKDPMKKKKAQQIIAAARRSNVDPSIAAKAHDVANKGGVADTGNNAMM